MESYVFIYLLRYVLLVASTEALSVILPLSHRSGTLIGLQRFSLALHLRRLVELPPHLVPTSSICHRSLRGSNPIILTSVSSLSNFSNILLSIVAFICSTLLEYYYLLNKYHIIATFRTSVFPTERFCTIHFSQGVL